MDKERESYWQKMGEFALEYSQDKEAHQGMGTAFESYIRSRCKDEDLSPPSPEQMETLRLTTEQRIPSA